MIDLMKYFRILFLSPQISRLRLKAFADKHIVRLTTNNPGGIFDGILADMIAAYTAYFQDIQDIDIVNAALKSLNASTNNAQRALLEKIRELEPYIKYTYRNDVAVYLLFYPAGLNEYNDANQLSFESLAVRFKSTLTTHSADFPPAELTAFTTLMGNYSTARTNENAAEGTAGEERSEIGNTKKVLCTQLTFNLLTIALHFLGDEAKCEAYFDQAILRAAFTDNSTAEGELNIGETQNCFSNTKKPDTQYRIKLQNEGTVRIAFKETEEQEVRPDEGQEAVGGQDWILVTASAIGYSSEKKFLNITNTGGATCNFIMERV